MNGFPRLQYLYGGRSYFAQGKFRGAADAFAQDSDWDEVRDHPPFKAILEILD